MTTHTMTLLEAAEYFRSLARPIVGDFPTKSCACTQCGAIGTSKKAIPHDDDCGYAAAVRAIEQARKEVAFAEEYAKALALGRGEK